MRLFKLRKSGDLQQQQQIEQQQQQQPRYQHKYDQQNQLDYNTSKNVSNGNGSSSASSLKNNQTATCRITSGRDNSANFITETNIILPGDYSAHCTNSTRVIASIEPITTTNYDALINNNINSNNKSNHQNSDILPTKDNIVNQLNCGGAKCITKNDVAGDGNNFDNNNLIEKDIINSTRKLKMIGTTQQSGG